MINLRDPKIFESEVRRIARALWPTANYSGPTILDGLERDAIFITEDVVYYVEATVSKAEAKAIQDVQKLVAGAERLRKGYPNHAVQAVFVTLDDPTGHQGVAITNARGRVRHYTFDQLRARLVDARAYLAARSNYPFGSVRDPATDAPNIPESAFVPPTLFIKDESKPKRYLDIARSIQSGKQRYIILGDFGVGKSMLLKHIYLYLASQTLKNNDHKFPILLNLRDHREQTDPAESLSRHATRLGLDNPAQIIRAWRAGYVHLLLDGFDELPPRTTAQETKRVRDIRHHSVELVRKFIKDSSSDVSIVVAGRSNYFGSMEDLNRALGTENARSIELGDWSDEDLATFLHQRNLAVTVPEWVPRRPLLVGFLVSRGLLAADASGTGSDRAAGWSEMMMGIYDREANQMEVGIDGNTLLLIAARLASIARTKSSRLGPVNFADARKSYEDIVRGAPEDRAINAILRLPGLRGRLSDESWLQTSVDTPANSSAFIDEDFADVLSGIDISEYICRPYVDKQTYWPALQFPLGAAGVDSGALRIQNRNLTPRMAASALSGINDSYPASLGNIDVVNMCKSAGIELSRASIVIRDIHLQSVDFDYDEADVSGVTFQDCYFDRVEFFSARARFLPCFTQCYFGVLRSRFTQAELEGQIGTSVVDSFELVADGSVRRSCSKPRARREPGIADDAISMT